VRVEAHKLRKRLHEYYAAEGADHALRIDIPAGQYVPHFIPQPPHARRLSDSAVVVQAEETEAGAAATVAALEVLAPMPEISVQELAPPPAISIEPPQRLPEPRRSLKWIAGIVAVLAVIALLLAKISGSRQAFATPAAMPALPSGRDVRILVGLQNGSYTDSFGKVWQADRYFSGGDVFDSGSERIGGTHDQRLFRARREGVFRYDIPLSPGVYELRLYFADTLYGENNMAGGGEASRIFHVFANGAPILYDFDVVSDGGASMADIRAFKDLSPAGDGKLHLSFAASKTALPIISAIELTPGVAGKMRTLRMVSREHPYTDKQGLTWSADEYSRGGQFVMRSTAAAGIADPELLRGERFGNLTYVIPAPPGKYGVNLYFNEVWFGPGKFAGGGSGSRVFDILCDGVTVRRGFDVFREAEGNTRAVVLPLHGVEPDEQGKIVINLKPIHNYALLNALEVWDESR
jgi:hypothetical protein